MTEAARTGSPGARRRRTVAGAVFVAAGCLAGAACERVQRPAAAPQPQRGAPSPEEDRTMGGSRPDAARVHEAGGTAPSSDAPFVRFTDVTEASGLGGFRLHAGRHPPNDWIVETVGGGVIVADLDGDADLDLVLVDGAGVSRAGAIEEIPGAGTRVYRNDGGLRFTDVTDASGAGVRGYGLGGAAADWDGDGDADLCIAGWDMLHLLRNRGDGTFEDVTAAAGVVPRKHDVSTACAWADVDGDGRLDLFVSNYVDQKWVIDDTHANRGGDPKHCRWRSHLVYCGPRGVPALANRLFLQREPGRFTDVSVSHLVEPVRASFQAVFSDFDDDGDLDAYVANDGIENCLLVNDGAGHMKDRAVEAGCAASMDFEPQGSMGVSVADLDHDGRMDVAVTNFAWEYNALYRNRTKPGGKLLFEDVSITSRFSRSPQDRVCWGVGLRDLDFDGDLDCLLVAGHVYSEEELDPLSKVKHRQQPRVLRNLGGAKPQFEDVTDRAGDWCGDARLWRGLGFGDFDGDGDFDVVATAQHAAPAVVRNDGGEKGGWVRFDLRSKTGTPAGARVIATLPDGTIRVGEVACGSSYAGSDDPRVTIGLGAVTVLPKVEIRWPGERVAATVLRDVATRTTHVVERP